MSKSCNNCKHQKWTIFDRIYTPFSKEKYAECISPQAFAGDRKLCEDIKTQIWLSKKHYCDIQRNDNVLASDGYTCGPEGRFFEEKSSWWKK